MPAARGRTRRTRRSACSSGASGDQLSWRLVMIGLREEASEARGPHLRRRPRARALAQSSAARYGMPFATVPKERPAGNRARLPSRRRRRHARDPGSEWRCSRALQLANFTTPAATWTTPRASASASRSPGIDADAIVDARRPDVVAEYERQRAEARSAAGTPAEAQDKTATSDGLCASRRRRVVVPAR